MNAELRNKNQSHRPRNIHSTGLWFILLPLGVFTLANILFVLVAFDIDELVGKLSNVLGAVGTSVEPFVEARSRLLWGTTVLLFYTASFAMAVFCIGVIRQSVRGRDRLIFAVIGSLIAMLMLGHFAYSGHVRSNFSYIFYFTFDVLTASKQYTIPQLTVIRSLVTALNVLAALIPVLALIAGCCIMTRNSQPDKSQLGLLVAQMSRLRMFIMIGSTLLVTGVLHMIAWLRFPAALIGNVPLAKDIMSFSEAIGLYWGATFSLVAATFYIPAAWRINRWAKAIIEENPDQSKGMQSQEWLEKHNLSLSPFKQMPQLVAVLAPLLVGPIGASITNLSTPFMGG